MKTNGIMNSLKEGDDLTSDYKDITHRCIQ